MAPGTQQCSSSVLSLPADSICACLSQNLNQTIHQKLEKLEPIRWCVKLACCTRALSTVMNLSQSPEEHDSSVTPSRIRPVPSHPLKQQALQALTGSAAPPQSPGRLPPHGSACAREGGETWRGWSCEDFVVAVCRGLPWGFALLWECRGEVQIFACFGRVWGSGVGRRNLRLEGANRHQDVTRSTCYHF